MLEKLSTFQFIHRIILQFSVSFRKYVSYFYSDSFMGLIPYAISESFTYQLILSENLYTSCSVLRSGGRMGSLGSCILII